MTLAPGVTVDVPGVRAVLDRVARLTQQAQQELTKVAIVGVFLPELQSFRAHDRLGAALTEVRRMQVAVSDATHLREQDGR